VHESVTFDSDYKIKRVPNSINSNKKEFLINNLSNIAEESQNLKCSKHTENTVKKDNNIDVVDMGVGEMKMNKQSTVEQVQVQVQVYDYKFDKSNVCDIESKSPANYKNNYINNNKIE